MKRKPLYSRVLLKVSGEFLAGEKGFGISPAALRHVALELKAVREAGVQTGVVIGGGNIFRGLSAEENGMERVTCDFMGMLATCINGLALQDVLEKEGVSVRVMTAVDGTFAAEPYIRRRALRHLDKGRLLIFAGGTGNPYFTTDTAAALRAMEIRAELMLKATKTDGVFDKDPALHKDSKKFKSVSCKDVLKKGLKVLDSTAISLCMDNKMPLIVFNLKERGNLLKALCGDKTIGTVIK